MTKIIPALKLFSPIHSSVHAPDILLITYYGSGIVVDNED